MNDLIVVPQTNQWQKLKALVLDSVSSPITKRVYNLGLDEFFAWYGLEPRAGFTKATVSAWRVALEARGLGSVSINVRITAVRKLAVEASDNGRYATRKSDFPVPRRRRRCCRSPGAQALRRAYRWLPEAEKRRAPALPVPGSPVRRSAIRNSQAPSLLTKRLYVRILFGEPNISHFEFIRTFG